MALKFMDGFDHYASADITKKWSTVASGVTINSTGGRRGSGSLRFGNFGTHFITKTLGANYQTFILGFALNITALPSSESIIIQVLDTSTVQATVTLTTAGTFKVYKGTTAGTLLGTTTGSITANTYNYLELKIKVDASTGTIDLYKNGSSILSLTAQNTQNSSNAYLNVVQLGGTTGGGTATIDFDDLYICDNTTSFNNNVLGDVRVETTFPVADGTPSTWIPSTGTAHYSLVDESTPNTTDYISSNVVANRDSFDFANLGGTVSNIFGVQVNAAALKDDTGSRTIGMSTKSNGTTTDSAGQALSTDQMIYSAIFETDPNSATYWTQTALNAAEFGVRVVS